MMLPKMARMAAVAACLMGIGTTLPAATINTNLVSPDNLVTFSEVVLPTNTALTNQYQAQGVTFTGLFFEPAFPSPFLSGDLITNMSGHTIGNFQIFGFPMNQVSPFSIHFENNVSAASFNLVANTQLTQFDALLGGSLVETVQIPTSGSFNNIAEAFGFVGIEFDEIRVTSSVIQPQSFRIDNLAFNDVSAAAVPLPASLSFGLLAVAMLGGVAARKRKTV